MAVYLEPVRDSPVYKFVRVRPVILPAGRVRANTCGLHVVSGGKHVIMVQLLFEQPALLVSRTAFFRIGKFAAGNVSHKEILSEGILEGRQVVHENLPLQSGGYGAGDGKSAFLRRTG